MIRFLFGLLLTYLVSIDSANINSSIALAANSSHTPNFNLSFNWVNRESTNNLTRLIKQHQSRCTDKVYFYHQRNYGMGSEVHVWTQAVCNAMEKGGTLVHANDPWVWNDHTFCPNHTVQPYTCYFNMNLSCANSMQEIITMENNLKHCPSYVNSTAERSLFRAAGIEYLFSRLNPRLVEAAQRAITWVFGASGVPQQLITVHVSWGDKGREMKLVPPGHYFKAVVDLIHKHNLTNPHIFITTDTIDGLGRMEHEFRYHKKDWPVYCYTPAIFNNTAHHTISPVTMAKSSDGAIGKASLISLLLSLEARYYVLTTGSNWSRLINELRLNVVNPTCGGNNCTDMIDLRKGEWR